MPFLLTDLRKCLNAAEEGNWEPVVEFVPALLPALAEFRSSINTSAPGSVGRRQLNELHQVLQQLIAVCSTRKEQIAPLVNALKVTQPPPDES